MHRYSVVAVVVLFSAIAVGAQAQVLRASVISAGAASSTRAGIVLKGSVGQPVIGRATGATQAGLGFWYSVLAKELPSAVDGMENAPSGMRLGSASPNPFSSVTSISADFHESGFLTLLMFDISGRLVFARDEGFQTPGNARFTIAAEGLPSGRYLLVARFNGGQSLVPLLIAK
ncbi:MAG: hypothetical protein IPP94_10945 [Ignavibacteria bacterium]|nr:hypothetical protein [Ignavibacteria bacterium]